MAIAKPYRSIQSLLSFFESITSHQKTLDFFQILLASCFMGICAQIKIPLHFTPIPFTVQTTGVMLIGAFLGPRKGACAILCYLMQGWIGLPVWAGGAWGWMHFMGPTGGYLMAYILQVSFIGWLLKKQKNSSFLSIVTILLLSVCFQLGIGSLWLAQFVGIKKCFLYGFYPFILTECAKSILTASLINNVKNRSTNSAMQQ